MQADDQRGSSVRVPSLMPLALAAILTNLSVCWSALSRACAPVVSAISAKRAAMASGVRSFSRKYAPFVSTMLASAKAPAPAHKIVRVGASSSKVEEARRDRLRGHQRKHFGRNQVLSHTRG